MRGKIPYNRNILLVKPKIYSGTGYESNISQLFAVKDLLDLKHWRRVEECMPYHCNKVVVFSVLHHFFGFFCVFGKRLFHKYVLARLHGLHGQRVMAGNACSNYYSINRWVIKNVFGVQCFLTGGESFCDLGQTARITVTDHDLITSSVGNDVSKKIGTPVPKSYHSNVSHFSS